MVGRGGGGCEGRHGECDLICEPVSRVAGDGTTGGNGRE